MSGSETDRSLRGYRAASESLDERPSAATRNAILAAAARQAQTGPRDARAPVGSVRRRQRWPYAAAAALLLSTLAVMMATRTEQEMPSFSGPGKEAGRDAAPAAERAPAQRDGKAEPVVAESTVAAAPALQASSTSRPEPAIVQRETEPTQGRAKAARSAPSAPAPAIASREAKRTAPAAATRNRDEAAGLRASPPAQAGSGVEASPAAADVVPEPLAKRPAAPPGESGERRRNDGEVAVSRAAPPALAAGALEGNVRSEADAIADNAIGPWLERIIKLRRAGQHEAADAELKRFRARYPQATIPPEALAVTGTR